MLRTIIVSFWLIYVMSFSSVVFATDESLRFLSMADIHFNPFATCHTKNDCPTLVELQRVSAEKWPEILAKQDKVIAKSGEDTNFPLLIVALTQAKQIGDEEKINFVLVLGDFLGHHFRQLYTRYSPDKSSKSYQLFVKKTLMFLSQELANYFPHTNVYVLIGNNDSYQNDYVSQPEGLFFKESSEIFAPLIHDKKNRTIFKNEFHRNGYYAVDLLHDNKIRLLMLNTVLFSKKTKGQNISQTAQQELNWLSMELIESNHDQQKVILAMHIPSSIDLYIAPNFYLFSLAHLWKQNYTQEFMRNLKEYAPTIAGIFSGHLHLDWYRILNYDHGIPIFGVPAVSPIFGKSGFTVYTYSLPDLKFKYKKLYQITT